MVEKVNKIEDKNEKDKIGRVVLMRRSKRRMGR